MDAASCTWSFEVQSTDEGPLRATRSLWTRPDTSPAQQSGFVVYIAHEGSTGRLQGSHIQPRQADVVELSTVLALDMAHRDAASALCHCSRDDDASLVHLDHQRLSCYTPCTTMPDTSCRTACRPTAMHATLPRPFLRTTHVRTVPEDSTLHLTSFPLRNSLVPNMMVTCDATWNRTSRVSG